MKKQTILLLFSLVILLVSCGKGLSVEEKNEVENFEKEMVTKNDFFQMQQKQMFSMELNIENLMQKEDLDSLQKDNLRKIDKELKKIKSLVESQYLKWNKKKTAWGNSKEKAMRDELSYDEIKSQMEDISQFMTGSNMEQMKWEKQLNDLGSKMKNTGL